LKSIRGTKFKKCYLCGLKLKDGNYSKHHLIPQPYRKLSPIKDLANPRNKTIFLCNGCHQWLHQTFDNLILATNKLSELLEKEQGFYIRQKIEWKKLSIAESWDYYFKQI